MTYPGAPVRHAGWEGRKMMRYLRLLVLAYSPFANSCAAQRPALAGATSLPDCEWCGTGEAPAALTSTMRIGVGEPGERLVITGTIYQNDGRTPAAGVVLYAYHTNAAG